MRTCAKCTAHIQPNHSHSDESENCQCHGPISRFLNLRTKQIVHCTVCVESQCQVVSSQVKLTMPSVAKVLSSDALGTGMETRNLS